LKRSPQELLALAFRLLSAGQLEEAQRACRKAIQARPDIPEAHLLLSEIHHQSGDAAKAREPAERALRLRPGWSEACFALGNAEALAGNLERAEEQFRAAIGSGSPGPGAYANLGHVLRRQGRLPEARQAYESALERDPDSLELQLNVITTLSDLGETTQALHRAQAATERFPGSPQAFFALGNVLTDLARNEEAASSFGRAVELDPSFWSARFNLARALLACRRIEQAVSALYELLDRNPGVTDAREQLLKLLHATRRFAEMERVAREGMAVHPDLPVYAHQYGVALWWQARHDEAMAAYAMSERLAKDRTSPAYHEAKLDEACSLLALGRWKEGWEGYRWRPPRPSWRARFPQLLDDPTEVAALHRPGRILIFGEQGLGDEIFFLRFAKRLRERGHRLLGRYDPKLLPLLARIPDLFDQVLSPEDAAGVQADANILSGDLPLAADQYLAPPLVIPVDPARRAAFEARMREFGPAPYVGVTWRGGALRDERTGQRLFYLDKDVPPSELGAILKPLDATVVILQRRPSAEDQERFLGALGRPALDLSYVNDDLCDALAALSILDDYVGVSNTNTHLRAACPGKIARVLVQYPPEWRWGAGVIRSPWFPEFPTYRQTHEGQWAPPLAALAADLATSLAALQHRVG
jgi:tetratricopeptide (TPR) repeat protein